MRFLSRLYLSEDAAGDEDDDEDPWIYDDSEDDEDDEPEDDGEEPVGMHEELRPDAISLAGQYGDRWADLDHEARADYLQLAEIDSGHQPHRHTEGASSSELRPMAIRLAEADGNAYERLEFSEQNRYMLLAERQYNERYRR
jgi:hypothetical protein